MTKFCAIKIKFDTSIGLNEFYKYIEHSFLIKYAKKITIIKNR